MQEDRKPTKLLTFIFAKLYSCSNIGSAMKIKLKISLYNQSILIAAGVQLLCNWIWNFIVLILLYWAIDANAGAIIKAREISSNNFSGAPVALRWRDPVAPHFNQTSKSMSHNVGGTRGWCEYSRPERDCWESAFQYEFNRETFSGWRQQSVKLQELAFTNHIL